MVGSNVTIKREEGKSVRGREYPWGVVDIENKVPRKEENMSKYIISLIQDCIICKHLKFYQDHCDFTTVQNLLWGQNTQDLIESTHQVNFCKIF